MVDDLLNDTKVKMQKAVDALGRELMGIRTGRANPALVERLMVEYYGALTPLHQMASITAPEARLLVIHPWDKAAVHAILALVVIALAAVVLSSGPSDGAPGGLPLPFHLDFPNGMEYYPFGLLILAALYFGRRDKFALACWSAVLPIGLMLSTYAFSGGWPQFGDRFALDYYPFLFLLAVSGMGGDLKWHHKALIALSIAINLWGIVWIYKFQAHGYLGLEWVTW